jgi:hypothetical protein
MRWQRAVVTEIWGLFVDDGWFALSIVVWLGVGWGLPRFGLPPALACVLFAGGLAALLAVSALRRSGQRG